MVKWIVGKDELESAVALVDNVPSRPAVLCSEYIRIQDNGKKVELSLSSDMFVRAAVKGKNAYGLGCDLYLDRRLFVPFVTAGSELSAGEYAFHINGEGHLIIEHGARRAVYVKSKKVSGYGDVPAYSQGKTLEVSDDFSDALKCAAACATADPMTPFLNCVYVRRMGKKVLCYATNGDSIVIRIEVAQEVPLQEDIAFPLDLAKLCAGFEAKKFTWDSKSAMIVSPEGRVWQSVKVEARKSFPADSFAKIMAAMHKGKPVCGVSLSSLAHAAGRLGSCLSGVTREDLLLRLLIRSGKKTMGLKAGTSATRFSEHIKLVSSGRDDYEIDWPLVAALPVIEFMKKDGEGHLYIDSDGRTMLSSKRVNLVVAKVQKNGK